MDQSPTDCKTAVNTTDKAPAYDSFRASMRESRGLIAEKLARQALATSEPFLTVPTSDLAVLDVGCGYGHTALELSRHCKTVVGIEPSTPLVEVAQALAADAGRDNLQFRHEGAEDLAEVEAFDLAIMDNVLEHLPRGVESLAAVARSLKPGGVLYIVVPNKLWPIEHHYYLPFLGYLPVPWANRYLRLTGRGTDFTDASYAPTVGSLRRMIGKVPGLKLNLVPPADVSLTMAGGPLHYRLGVKLLKRVPILWWCSKVLLAVVEKTPGESIVEAG